ncbi:MAG TPA: serine/threonine-protein kinase [Bacteroidota bacterium]|nr:serine/threonine-protein kinase [Bacteroidota bacterium]
MSVEASTTRNGQMLQIGDQFDHYQIRAHIAQGGMSNIYRAYDLLAGKEVALKIPDRAMIGDPAQYERFQRELEVMRTLHHPAIQRGLASGQYNNTPYLVTELVTGESLRDVIQRTAPLAPEAATALIRKVADGLSHCHDNDIIHRDLKPENILITEGGQPVILDFGLALTKGSHRVTYANLSATAGTPEYMAPEQIEGARGDRRTDLYALGIIYYELLTGKTPFSGDNPLAVMAQHLNAVPPRLDRQGVSPALAAVVARCLARNPDDRYADMQTLIRDLDNPAAVDTSILDHPAEAERAPGFRRSPVMTPIAIAAVLLLAIIAIAFGLQALR